MAICASTASIDHGRVTAAFAMIRLMPISNDAAARIARGHGLDLPSAQALAAMADTEAEADDLAASFATSAAKQFDDALRAAYRADTEPKTYKP